ncbi:GPW/gp25 family protein [Nostoc piscinale]|uniref:GPW/gp25 family protein n=1 Tax=Nostoc piscinale TaxID=224012 RepID=UPI001187677D|nr:GPW/gp25 family protein [Nostoc piscinale]
MVASDADLYRGHILSWLLTEKGERIMRPRYGLKDYLFTAVPDLDVITAEMTAGLTEYIPECQFTLQGTINDLGETVITVFWSYLGEDQLALNVTF